MNKTEYLKMGGVWDWFPLFKSFRAFGDCEVVMIQEGAEKEMWVGKEAKEGFQFWCPADDRHLTNLLQKIYIENDGFLYE